MTTMTITMIHQSVLSIEGAHSWLETGFTVEGLGFRAQDLED